MIEDFRREAERTIDTLQKARREDGVSLLVALLRWAESYGKIAGVDQFRQAMADNREQQLDHDEDRVDAFR